MYFADTYALVEILKGNPSYTPYTLLITTEFNLLELAYALVRDFGQEKALETIEKVRQEVIVVNAGDEDYVEAAKLRIKLRKEGLNISLIDALGYTIAKRMGIPFLTGDKAFKGLENVEYVR